MINSIYYIKLLNMLLFFIQLDNGRTSKVGIMKYLFYSDFTFYRDYGKTISNEKYIKLPNGPCPDKWESYLNCLLEEDLIKNKRQSFIDRQGNIKYGDYYILENGIFNNELFEPEEIQRMENIYKKLHIYNSTQLSKISHNEVAYIKSMNGWEINLKYAFFIDLLEIDDEDEDDEELLDDIRKTFYELEVSGAI